jgi:hypothetical protein
MEAKIDNKCAHIPCICTVPKGQKFCSDFCADAGSQETEIGCDCGHPACGE